MFIFDGFTGNENEETIKPKYTAELPIIISKFCGVRVLYYQNQ